MFASDACCCIRSLNEFGRVGGRVGFVGDVADLVFDLGQLLFQRLVLLEYVGDLRVEYSLLDLLLFSITN